MYKLTQPDGLDFYSRTINYRKAIGTTIRIKDYDPKDFGVCGRGLHASRNPNDCFIGAKIPCAAFRVKGVNKIAGDSKKVRYQGLKIIEEIHDLDKLFGWNYSEAINPINPFKIKAPEVDENVIQLLKEWSSINHYIFGSFEEGDPVWYSVGGFVWESVWYSIGNSIWKSVAESVKSSTWYSVRNFIYVYIGSLFPNIKKWGDVQQKQSGVCLWKLGFVPSYNGKVWRLYSGENAKIVWEGEL